MLRLTARDHALLTWIHQFGFVEIGHIAQWMKVAKPTVYARVNKLIQSRYLAHQRIFHGAPGILVSGTLPMLAFI